MNICHRMLRLTATLLTVCLLATPAWAQIPEIPKFDSFYVFGDSLVDNGNIFALTKAARMEPAVPPSESPNRTYFDGRFSNGYVGVEFLWERLSGHAPGSRKGLKPLLGSPVFGTAAAVNFAYGGTGTPYLDQTPGGFWAPGLKGQVELFRLYLRGRRPSRAALYMIATGANDYRQEFNVPMAHAEVAANIAQSINQLYQLGARDVMVLDLPNLGLIPANGSNPTGPASQISVDHNAALEKALAALRLQRPELHLIEVTLDDVFLPLLSQLEWQAPALAVLSPGTPTDPGAMACLFTGPSLCPDIALGAFKNEDLGFLFWDIVHPTTQTYRKLANYLYNQLVESY
jgi:phospholipase/lecithinase/hemolysin